MEKTIRLNLACGRDYRDGYINIDNQSMFHGDMKVDVVGDVFTLDWEDNTVDEIVLSHFMMYVDTFEAQELFSKWNKWLKTGGTLEIETGDLKKIAKTVLNTSDEAIINGTNGVMQLFGWDTTKGHKWAWCADTIVPVLERNGFSIISVIDGGSHNRPERDVTIKAIKI